jgi:hypothetical protein
MVSGFRTTDDGFLILTKEQVDAVNAIRLGRGDGKMVHMSEWKTEDGGDGLFYSYFYFEYGPPVLSALQMHCPLLPSTDSSSSWHSCTLISGPGRRREPRKFFAKL